MGFVERLRVMIDVTSDKATAGIAAFRHSVAEANGFAGKLKAGVGSLGSMFGSFIKSPMGAAAAVTAAGAAMYKAVTAASDLALEVGRLKDATGLSADEASRWIEVAKDMGLGADTVAGLLTKLEVNIGKNPEKFKELGLQIRYANDGTVDANGTMLAAIDLLKNTEDPAKRAALAQQLFGKSWKDASELITAGADNVKARLDEVKGAKLIDQAKIDQARKFRDSMDDLVDVGEDLALTIGQAVIPMLTGVATVSVNVIDGVKSIDSAFRSATGGAIGFGDALELGILGPLKYLAVESARESAEVNKSFREIEEASQSIAEDAFPAVVNAADFVSDALVVLGDEGKEAAQKTYDLADAEADAAREAAGFLAKVKALTTELDTLRDTVEDRKAWTDLQIELRDMADAYGEMDAGSLEAKSALDEMRLALIDTLTAMKGIPPEVVTEIVSHFDPANIDKSIAEGQKYIDDHAILKVGIQGVGVRGSADTQERAAGIYIENATFNSTQKLSPDEVASLIREWRRRNGSTQGFIGGSQ